MTPKPLNRRLFNTAAALVLAPALSRAQPAWPTQPLKILVGFPPGTTPDLAARALAEPLAQRLGQPVVVENKPGASGNIAADQLARAADGHTLGVLINGNLTIARLLNPATPFDPARDFAPVTLVGTAPLVMVASAAATGTTPAEWLAWARQQGDRASYGSPGVGTVGHLGMELIKARAGLAAQHVPFGGYPQVVQALLGGQLQLALLPPATAMAQVRAGKLKPLGSTAPVRSLLVPELPTLREAGVPAELEIWVAVAAPAAMPAAHLARLNAALVDIIRGAEGRQRLFGLGWQAAGTAPEGLANRMKSDTALLGGIINARGIKAE